MEMLKTELAGEFEPRDSGYVKTKIAVPEGKEINRIVEEIAVVQSKLCIGLKCGIEPTSKEYYALMLGGNGLLVAVRFQNCLPTFVKN